MVKSAPKIDKRTATEITQQLQELLLEYAPTWQESEIDPVTGKRLPKKGTISAVLIGTFARFAEIIIERLNQVPDKNFLAFLDLLGASRLPPQAARTPLTFSLAAGSTVDVVVPVGTQVAAPPAEGEKAPVIFETEAELVVTAAQLTSVFVREPQQDTWSDRTGWLTTKTATAGFVFHGDAGVEHSLYLACDDLFTLPVAKTATLTIQSEEAQRLAGLPLTWSYWDGQDWRQISQLVSNISENNQSWQVSIPNFPVPVKQIINGVEASWLKVALNQSLIPGSPPLPKIQGITASVSVTQSNLLPDLGFINSSPLDLTKDFSPFGENPRLSDTLYLASQEVFSKAGARVTVNITLNETVPVNSENEVELAFDAWDGKTWQPLLVTSSSPATAKFTQSGSITFTLPNQIGLGEVNGKTNYWIRVRIVRGNYGTGISSQPPTFTTLRQEIRESTEQIIVNSSRGFMPGDRIQIAAGTNTQEIRTIGVVNTSNNSLTLTESLQSPHPVGTGVWLISNTLSPPLLKSLTLTYTYNATQSLSACQTYNNFTYIQQKEQPFIPFEALTESHPSLYLGFTLPPTRSNFPNRPLSLFVSLADLKYGEKFIPLSPPYSRQVATTGIVTHPIWVTNDTDQSVTWRVEIWGNNWETTISEEGTSITLAPGEIKSLKVQITIPEDLNQENRDIAFLRLSRPDTFATIYTATLETFVADQLPPMSPVRLSWQYWNGQAWSKLTVDDGSENFTLSGLIKFLVPADCQTKAEFDLSERYWLRVQWETGDYLIEPRIINLALNTTFASQTITIVKEILGSSNGSENQIFQTTRFPVLQNPQLEVREPEKPSELELERLKLPGNSNPITPIPNSREVWVQWQQVPDFYGSTSRDRHYVLDQLTGKIRFGNGRNGLIPPLGTGNLRIARYQTGGGKAGNKPVDSIVQLKTTVPYIEKVTNLQAAVGGAEAETLESLRDRLPETIRHRDRAVTLEDYEDLAKLASPEVARAKCLPLHWLGDPPEQAPRRGTTSIIIVPRSEALKPLPSLELISRVEKFLRARACPTVEILVVGPPYIPVSVNVEIALSSLEGASAVEQAVKATLEQFLHPLTGGLDGNGWDFGREPYKSDFYALLEAVPGVSYIRRLLVDDGRVSQEVEAIRKTGRFLVYSGTHTISLFFEES
ncbi:MAG: putative baseplate assembly protein [Microcystis sp. M54BS1]|uniref:putative baseplate assembly protein n=1 Tax=unclassified Microcystis TaxID=2643300 RepID=UPI00257FC758|nr:MULTISPECIES: putative baseplate assembly protein [unclassified Microcystis]MCA2540062.1 putative baseplate assembly protein [Microcystis sp. M54BS1]MCA2595852.1 putative baseplate assembly protein [Microcystis sp. M38BS1]MCA2612376.1 putative baseplate assembly protein [Microcystis sp. M27BS1]MCA2507761.1 putative baseplate assembly protein [Microcystis sp. M62BS1]MCA2509128.1 putative baseplate assembly protein [Microcystis sp. M60BS1]